MQATLTRTVNESEYQEPTDRTSGGRASGGRLPGGAEPGVCLLCAVLRGQRRGPSAERAVNAFVESLRRPLLRYCEGLTRQAGGMGRSAAIGTDRHVDAEDLAQEVWAKALKYLSGARGDRVTDDDHFARLLRRTAKTIYLDRVTKGAAPAVVLELDAPMPSSSGAGLAPEGEERALRDVLAAPAQRSDDRPDGLLYLDDERYAPLIEMLLTDEELFHRTYRRKHQRRPRQYQALVLYQLGTLYRREAVAVTPAPEQDAGGAQIMEDLLLRCVRLLGIPEESWMPVAVAAQASARMAAAADLAKGGDSSSDDVNLDEAVLAAVNEVCGTNVKAANMLAVLRYELNQFVEREREGAR